MVFEDSCLPLTLCRPPQVEQVGVWQRARFGRLCGMMKAQEIQFNGVRMYMWCLKILASHRRSFFLKDRVVHLRSSRLVSGCEHDLVACVFE